MCEISSSETARGGGSGREDAAILAGVDAREALRLLKSITDSGRAEIAVVGLGSPHDRVRKKAALVLGHYEVNAAVPALATRLHDAQVSVRIHAARALGRIGSNDATEALGSALNDERNAVVMEAARALRRIGGTEAHQVLFHALAGVDRRRAKIIRNNLRSLERGRH